MEEQILFSLCFLCLMGAWVFLFIFLAALDSSNATSANLSKTSKTWTPAHASVEETSDWIVDYRGRSWKISKKNHVRVQVSRLKSITMCYWVNASRLFPQDWAVCLIRIESSSWQRLTLLLCKGGTSSPRTGMLQRLLHTWLLGAFMISLLELSEDSVWVLTCFTSALPLLFLTQALLF